MVAGWSWFDAQIHWAGRQTNAHSANTARLSAEKWLWERLIVSGWCGGEGVVGVFGCLVVVAGWLACVESLCVCMRAVAVSIKVERATSVSEVVPDTWIHCSFRERTTPYQRHPDSYFSQMRAESCSLHDTAESIAAKPADGGREGGREGRHSSQPPAELPASSRG